MQQFRLRVVIITSLLLSIVLISNNKNVWASPGQSPIRQTVPTRVRTPTPIEIPTSVPPTNTPNVIPTLLPPTDTPPTGPQPQLPTKTETPYIATATLPTPTRSIVPTQSPTQTATTLQHAPAVTVTRSGITTTSVASTVTSIIIKVVPTPPSSPDIAGRIKNVSIAGTITVIFVLAILGVLVLVLRRRRSR
jgi:hypothetical protein